MSAPGPAQIFAAIDATWPPRRVIELPGWRVREGAGGGNRVASASATGPAPDIAAMEAAQAALGQEALVMLRPEEPGLDRRLATAGYAIRDPVTVRLGPVDGLAVAPPPVTAFQVAWPPVQIQFALWAAGGIGPERVAVMDRAEGPKCAILGRADDQPAGTAFVACHGQLAMVHALEVAPAARRRGLARHMMQGAALWAKGQGATWLAALVTDANKPANALYSSLGMAAVARYHYRVRPATEEAR